MKLIDDPDLIINLPDILRPLMLANLYVDIPIDDELAPIVQLAKLIVETVQQPFEDESADYGPCQDEDYVGDEEGVETVQDADVADVEVDLQFALCQNSEDDGGRPVVEAGYGGEVARVVSGSDKDEVLKRS